MPGTGRLILQTDQEYGELPDSLSDRKDIRRYIVSWASVQMIMLAFRIGELRARVTLYLRRRKREHHGTLSFEPDIDLTLSARYCMFSEQPVPLQKQYSV